MNARSALDGGDFQRMVMGARQKILENEKLLGELDRAVGDGDHGSSMRRAMDLASAVAAESANAPVSGYLRSVGTAVLAVDGGASGPLFGSFFIGMAEAANGHRLFGPKEVSDLLDGALHQLRKRTKAEAGDKTVMDALIPAVAAAERAAMAGSDVAAVLAAAATAAETGAAETMNFRAKYGRSKHQGERVVGHRDPGAVSMALILRAFAAVVAERLSAEPGEAESHA